ncbi:MAG: response regulator [Leptolyngbyaceae cyanobacterium SL_7_1]|nr:response regulator [Leptolyngbyaceae cyanobacterium SL_7_1]
MYQPSMHLLLVEDNLNDAELMHRTLMRSSFNCQLIRVGRLTEAIETCQSHRFNAVLLDLHLPDSRGLATLDEFHAAIPDLPVVVLTGFDDEDVAIEALARGAQDYLVKDQVTAQSLMRSIRHAVERGHILKRLQESRQITLKTLEKERELNNLRAHFVSMVSHEFRNPLTNIRTASELLQTVGRELNEHDRDRYFHQVNSAVKNLIELLDELMLLNTTEQSRFAFFPTRLNLELFCQNLVQTFQITAGDRYRIHLTTQGDCTQIEVDEILIRHILNNLLSNAIKYSPDGGAIQFDLVCDTHRTLFRICDQGIGIPQEEQSCLFEAFHRCSNVGRIEGTGLGMAIVKQCVDRHCGQIHIESAVGMGTTVTVSLSHPTQTQSKEL